MEKLTRVEVRWEDAHGSDGTLSAHEIDHKPYVFTTLGYLVRSDEVGVSVASEVGDDGKFRDVTFIPREMVIKETVSPKQRKKPSNETNPSLLLDGAQPPDPRS